MKGPAEPHEPGRPADPPASALASTSAVLAGGTSLSAIAAGIGASTGWRGTLLALLAGAASTLAQAPFHLWPVLAVTLPILLWSIDGAARSAGPLRRSAAAGYAFGFGYFFTGLSWIGEAFLVEAEVFGWLLPFAITLLPAAMAVYWALAAAAARWLWDRLAPDARAATPSAAVAVAVARVLLLAITFAIAEWVRGHALTGMPWNTLGLALTAPIELLQAAALFGMYGLTPVTVVVTATPLVVAAALGARPDQPPGGPAAALWAAAAAIGLTSLAPLTALYIYGAARLAAPPSPPLPGVMVRVVQPSIPQRDKWRADLQGHIFGEHLALSRQNAEGRIDDLAGVSHVVWPEASMPFGPLHTPAALEAIGDLLPDGVHLLAGVLRRDPASTVDPAGRQGARVYNSLAAFDAEGRPVTIYDKLHLVPFGEYLPFPTLLEAIGLQNLVRQRGGFAVGVAPRPLVMIPGLPPLTPIICYEAIFATALVQGPERPGLIVIVTNDGWFGNSTGPPQHLHQARVRAVEQGVSVIRAANNGISAVIDPEGRILRSLALDVRGSLDSAIPSARERPHSSDGGTAAAIALILLFFWIVFSILRRQNRVYK